MGDGGNPSGSQLKRTGEVTLGSVFQRTCSSAGRGKDGRPQRLISLIPRIPDSPDPRSSVALSVCLFDRQLANVGLPPPVFEQGSILI